MIHKLNNLLIKKKLYPNIIHLSLKQIKNNYSAHVFHFYKHLIKQITMDIEENFSELLSTIQNLYKNALLRKFFFNFLNIHYETTVFKAQPTLGRQKPKETPKAKVVEELKIDNKVEEALEKARKVFEGPKPSESKKPELKKPTNIKKPEPKPEIKKTVSKPVVKSKEPELLVSINPIECYDLTSIIINPDLMTKYQDLKSRYNSSLYSNLGGLSQGKKSEVTAKKNFLSKLNKKFTGKNIRTEVDEKVGKTVAAFKILNEIQLVLSDEEILRTFFELTAKNLENYKNKEERLQLYKANYMMN